MVEMHEIVPGRRFDRYHELGQHAFGEKLGLWIVVPQQLLVQISTCIVYMVTGGKSLKKFIDIVCPPPKCHEIELTYYILMFGSIHFGISHLPNFHSLSAISLSAAIMSLSYSTIAWGTSLTKGKAIDVSYSPREASTSGNVFNFFSALGDVAFAFAVCGYYAFGNKVDDTILITMQKPSWLVTAANAFVVIHVIGSYQVYAMPVFDVIETVLVRKLRFKPSITLRLIDRSLYVGITMFVGMAIPFFGGLMGFFGGFALASTSYYVLSSSEPIYVIRKIKEIPARFFKGATKLADYGNTTDPNSLNSVDAQKGSNLSNAIFFQGGKQVKIKARRFSSSRSDEKIFWRTHRYKGLSPESSPQIEYTTSFTDLTNQTTGPSIVNELVSTVLSPVPIDPKLSVNLVTDPDDTQLTRVLQPEDILSYTQTKEEVSLIDIFKKMVTNLGTEVDKFSRDFIISSFQAIVMLITSSDLSKLLKSRETVSKHLMRLNGVVLHGDAGQTTVNWFVERVHQTFDLAEEISSHERFVKDIDHEDVEILSHKLSNHLKTLQDLNSQLKDFVNNCKNLRTGKLSF
ncbi:hypothetical protein ACH5RR_006448 [Cinchona calisaya]|uniref:Amino acid transporter transmembrane domain-containing protein n=1 Tax=Cinchona calisaya TaxID=153742 RepID=A0ABD3AP08_9GENT